MRNTYKILILFCIVITVIRCSDSGKKHSVMKDKIVFKTPVLTASKNSSAKSESAKEFPVLKLLASDNKMIDGVRRESKEFLSNKRLVYIQRVQDLRLPKALKSVDELA